MSNAVLAWALVLLTPVELLLVVRDLGASPLQFGLLMSLPCLGGLAGSALAPRIAGRYGVARTLRLSALLRAPTVALPALAPGGSAGLLVVGAAFAGLLFTAGIYNSVQNAYQQQVTPDPLRGRVSAAAKWLIGLGKPIAPVLGGLLAGWLPLRVVFVISALALLLPVVLLDRGRERRVGPGPAPAAPEESGSRVTRDAAP
jgi:MFS family permease